jgi:hypothetical protein
MMRHEGMLRNFIQPDTQSTEVAVSAAERAANESGV